MPFSLTVALLAAAVACTGPPPAGRLGPAEPDGAAQRPGTAGGPGTAGAVEPSGPVKRVRAKVAAALGRIVPRAAAGGFARENWERCGLDIAADIDLYAACTEAGLSPAAAAEIVAGAARESTADRWRSVASLLAIGAEPHRAWRAVRAVPGLDDLAALVAGSAASGTRVAAAAGRISARLRRRAEDRATAAGERAGVLMAMPLTFCFLPAFFALGLVPVVLGLGEGVFQ